MLRLATALAIVIAATAPAVAPSAEGAPPTAEGGPPDRPAAGMNREQNAPGAAGPKDHGVVQRGAQPNAGEVRPGNRDGDAPSAAAGDLVPRQQRRILGLPLATALLIAGVLVVLVFIAGVVIPGARGRDRARGGGTYGRGV